MKLQYFYNVMLCSQDESGNQVWICPTCGKKDDGSPMIGCDGCDAWYHWYVIVFFFLFRLCIYLN